ncbi:hypothetical protein [Bosea psychrotolerans]|uniref:Uncharacterized protein n=1 Tax=Bosea psychrotolerans TaxID=1871628 RepID=A0A2S4MBB5_9HYPH|nr:hypothetical protein [Bosea psychrotolerans]POR51909.1 hypothetical protein CYD53_106192 [Bosea psychrotolerans]
MSEKRVAIKGVAVHAGVSIATGIGHDGAAMSRAAAAYWLVGRIPTVEESKPEAATVA